jgi:hypothetical protein
VSRAGGQPENPGSSEELPGGAAVSGCGAGAAGGNFAAATPRTLIERWNGSSWKKVASPSPSPSSAFNVLSGVTATSASNAWAVGRG